MGGGGRRRRESPGAAGQRASGPRAPTSLSLALPTNPGHAASQQGLDSAAAKATRSRALASLLAT